MFSLTCLLAWTRVNGQTNRSKSIGADFFRSSSPDFCRCAEALRKLKKCLKRSPWPPATLKPVGKYLGRMTLNWTVNQHNLAGFEFPTAGPLGRTGRSRMLHFVPGSCPGCWRKPLWGFIFFLQLPRSVLWSAILNKLWMRLCRAIEWPVQVPVRPLDWAVVPTSASVHPFDVVYRCVGRCCGAKRGPTISIVVWKRVLFVNEPNAALISHSRRVIARSTCRAGWRS